MAGCPPDGFSEDGQLWGNPLYRWEKHKADGYDWWIRRMAAAGKRYDVVRIDHFRGFESYWAVPYGDETARYGAWLEGPGLSFIRALQQALPEARIGIAHGKMSEGEISEIWRQLVECEIDILVCTTIIETGVDVSNVNTLIIENADCFGLSQLYQLRGRVGRSNRRAYA